MTNNRQNRSGNQPPKGDFMLEVVWKPPSAQPIHAPLLTVLLWSSSLSAEDGATLIASLTDVLMEMNLAHGLNSALSQRGRELLGKMRAQEVDWRNAIR